MRVGSILLISFYNVIMCLEVQGHRGTAYEYENTIAAFELACKHGADSIELDVHCSADKKILVSHDSTFLLHDHLKLIRDFPYATIKSSSSIHGKFPLLKEVLDHFLIRAHAPIIDIEIKVNQATIDWPNLLQILIPLLDEYKGQLRLRLRSFEYDCIKYLSQHYKDDIKIGLLTDESVVDWQLLLEDLSISFIAPHISTVFPYSVNDAHKRGVQVIPWTANSYEEFKELSLCDVDGITTDYPDKLRNFLGVS